MMPSPLDEILNKHIQRAGGTSIEDVEAAAEPSPEKVAQFALETGKQIVGGGLEAVTQAARTVGVEEPERFIPQIEPPETTEGLDLTLQMIRSVSQGLTGFLPTVGALGKIGVATKTANLLTKANIGVNAAQKAGRVIQGGLAGVISEQIVFDPYESRLSDFVQQFPSLQNPVTEALQSNENDSEMRARLKMAAEGAITGVAFDLFFESVRGAKNSLKKLKGVKKPLVEDGIEKPTVVAAKQKIATPEDIEAFGQKEGLLTTREKISQGMFDGNFSKGKLQKQITGVHPDSRGIVDDADLITGDTALLPSFEFRRLAAVRDRIEQWIDNGGFKASGFAMDLVNDQGKVIQKAALAGEMPVTGNKGLREIITPFIKTGEEQDFFLYALAHRIRGRTLAGFEQPTILADFNPEDIIKEIENGANGKIYQDSLADLGNYTDDLLKYARDSHIISQDQFLKIKEVNPVYVPLNVINEEITRIGKVGPAGRPLKKLKGLTEAQIAESKLVNPLDSTVQYTSNIIRASDINRAKLGFYEMLEKGIRDDVPEALAAVRRVPSKAKPRVATTKSVFAALEDQVKDLVGKDGFDNWINKILRDVEESTGQSVAIKDVFDETLPVLAVGRELVVGKGANRQVYDLVFKQGKPILYEILDPDLMRSIEFNGVRNLDPLVNWATKGITSKINRYYSSAITHNPAFWTFNFIRDSISSTVNSNFTFLPLGSSLKGLKTALIDAESSRELFRSGGGFSARVQTEGLGMQHRFFNLAKEIEDPVLKKSLKIAGGSYSQFVQSLEMAARLAEYKMAKDSGLSSLGAAYLGREISTDFSMKGTNLALQVWNANTAFFNAGLQGVYRAGRKIAEKPLETALKATALVAVPKFAQWLINSEFEEYDTVPKHTKDTNYLFPYPKNGFTEESFNEWRNWVMGGGPKPALDDDVGFIAIPGPYDYLQLGTLVEGALEGMRSRNAQPLISAFGRSIMNTLPGTHLPTAYQPFHDIQLNENFFGGRIAPPYMLDDRLPEDVVMPRTSVLGEWVAGTLRKIGQVTMGLSAQEGDILTPIEADYLIDQFTPGLLDLAQEWVEVSFRDKNFGEHPTGLAGGQQISNNPFYALATITTSSVSRRFMVQNPAPGNPLMEDFWDIKKRADKVLGSDKISEKQFWDVLGLKQNWTRNSEEHGKLRAISPLMNEVAEGYRELKNTMTLIDQHPTMSGPDKQRQITNLKRTQDNMVNELMRGLQNARDLDILYQTVFGSRKEGFKPEQEGKTFKESTGLKLGFPTGDEE